MPEERFSFTKPGSVPEGFCGVTLGLKRDIEEIAVLVGFARPKITEAADGQMIAYMQLTIANAQLMVCKIIEACMQAQKEMNERTSDDV